MPRIHLFEFEDLAGYPRALREATTLYLEVVERIFGLAGIGKSFVNSAMQRDYTVVMGVVILSATLIITLNLVADLTLAALDPRVRLS